MIYFSQNTPFSSFSKLMVACKQNRCYNNGFWNYAVPYFLLFSTDPQVSHFLFVRDGRLFELQKLQLK